jgi:hypothetical protein
VAARPENFSKPVLVDLEGMWVGVGYRGELAIISTGSEFLLLTVPSAVF